MFRYVSHYCRLNGLRICNIMRYSTQELKLKTKNIDGFEFDVIDCKNDAIQWLNDIKKRCTIPEHIPDIKHYMDEHRMEKDKDIWFGIDTEFETTQGM